MTTIEITLTLPEKLASDARQLNLLTSESIAQLLQAEIERRHMEDKEEAAWEEAVLSRALGDALNPDGSLDFDKLDARSLTITLDELQTFSILDRKAAY